MRRINILLTTFAIIFIFSCKKKVNEAPFLNVFSPVQNLLVTSIDYINIKGYVQDDEQVSTVSINIVNSEMIAVSNSYILNIGKKSDSFNIFFKPVFYNNINFNFNIFYLKITAFDGEKYTNVFIKIGITVFDSEHKKYYVLTSNVSNSTDLYELDSTYNKVKLATFSDNINSAVFGNNLLLYKTISGEAILYDIENFNEIWSISNINNNIQSYNSHVDFIEDLYFISKANGSVIAVDNNKIIRKSFSISDSLYVTYYFVKCNDNLLIFSNSTNNKKRLDINNYSTESNINHIDIDFDVNYADIFENNIVIIFGNKNGKAVIAQFNLSTNIYNYTIDNVSTSIKSAVKITIATFYYSINNEIRFITEYFTNIWTLVENETADIMRFDKLNKILLIKNNNKLTISYTTTNYDFKKIKTIEFENEISEIVIK